MLEGRLNGRGVAVGCGVNSLSVIVGDLNTCYNTVSFMCFVLRWENQPQQT